MYWELVAVTIGASTITGDVYAIGATIAGLAAGLASEKTPAIMATMKNV